MEEDKYFISPKGERFDRSNTNADTNYHYAIAKKIVNNDSILSRFAQKYKVILYDIFLIQIGYLHCDLDDENGNKTVLFNSEALTAETMKALNELLKEGYEAHEFYKSAKESQIADAKKMLNDIRYEEEKLDELENEDSELDSEER